MSRETLEWLNEKTLIGDTDLRGKAWHYRKGATNHFAGAVPIERVRGLLLPYEPVLQPLWIRIPATQDDNDGFNSETGSFWKWHQVTNFQGIASDNDPSVLHAIHTNDYQNHPFSEWLIQNVLNLVDGNVHVSSTGLLQKGAVAWVELSIDQNLSVADFQYRPHLLASTSTNGRYRTEYGRKVQAVVCDNTLDMASRESGQSISYKHTKGSVARIADAREALGLIVATGDDFAQEINELLSWKVSSAQFSKWLDFAAPTRDENGELKHGAAFTRADNVRTKLATMYRGDDRVSPWAGTAFGVRQLSNTYWHHERGANKSTIRPERNMLDSIGGKTKDNDRQALTWLAQVSDKPESVLV